jgi:chemotaxis family two-component system response regulator Rcp1
VTTQPISSPHLHAGLGRPIQILLVEDSPSDVAMTVAALREGRVTNDLHVVGDGEDAMAFLRREAPYTEMPWPDLVILDLNLPRMDGREVLREMKNDEHLKTIPVVVLTTSAAEADVLRSYELHANSYVTKPVDYQAFLAAVRGLEEFWFSIVRLPPSTHATH